MNADYLIGLSSRCLGPIENAQLEAILQRQEDASLKSPGVEAHYYRYLYRLAKEQKPRVSVELGTHSGISAACIAEGNPDGRVVTVNHHEQLREECRRPNVTYLLQDSYADVPVESIDLLFIDTDHDGIRPKNEFLKHSSKVTPGGVVLFDDVNLFDCMRKFWAEFNPEGWIKFILPVHGNAGFGGMVRA